VTTLSRYSTALYVFTDPVSDIRAVLVAGVGFFLDSYDIFAINLITVLLGVVFWGDPNPQNGFSGNDGYLPDRVNQAFKASTSAGIVVGMIVFGWLAELVPLCSLMEFILRLDNNVLTTKSVVLVDDVCTVWNWPSLSWPPFAVPLSHRALLWGRLGS